MKLHVSVAALAAAAGAFSYGSQVRAQAITVAPVENITEGLVLEQDQNLIVNPGYSITNYDAEVAGTNAVLLQGTGYNGQRSIIVRGSIVNYDGTARVIAGASNISDVSNDSVTITVESTGSVSTDANGARGIVLNDNIIVNNYGSITANNVAIDVNDGSAIYNASSATIASLGAANAVQASDASGSVTISVTNAGDITGGTFNRRGVSASAGSASVASVTITNAGSGSITGGGGGVYAYGGDANVTISGAVAAPAGPQESAAAGETGFSGVIAQTFANSGHGPGYAAIDVRAGNVASLSLNVGEAGAVYANNGTAVNVSGEYAVVDITNAGEISSSGEFAEAGVRVNGEYGGSVVITNRSTGAIATTYGAAVDVALGAYEGEVGPLQAAGSGSVVINNDGQILRNDPGQGEQAYAPAAITAYAAGAGVTINNSGTISALVGGEVLEPEDGPQANVGNVEIYADGVAVDVEASNSYVTVVNDGLILAGYNGVSIRGVEGEFGYAADNVVSVTNGETGEIIANDHGIQVFNEENLYFGGLIPRAPGEYGATTYINNAGAITISDGGEFSEPGHAGIEVYSGTSAYVSAEIIIDNAAGDFPSYPGQANVDIVNSGSVTGGEYGVLVNISNYVEIDGEVAYDGSNGGVKLGGSDGRYAYGYTNVVVTNAQSGTIRARNGIYVDGDSHAYIQIANSGSITATYGDGVDVSAFIVNSVTVTNTGEIAAQGEIGESDSEGVTIGVYAAGAIAVENAGSATITALEDGVDVYAEYSDSITVINTGSATITAQEDGVDIEGEYAGSITVENTGASTIMAQEDGVDIDGEYAGGILVANRGTSTIASTGAEGVNIDFYGVGSATVINEAGASITGYNNAVDVYAEYAGSISVTNSGAVRTTGSEGEELQIGGREYAAVLVETYRGAGSITVSNTGEVTSDGGQGIVVLDGYNGLIWRGAAQPNETGEMAERSAITVQNDGSVYAYRDGVEVMTLFANDVVVNNSASGTIFSEYGSGVDVGAYSRIANAICSEEVCEVQPNTVTVTNDGEIAAYGDGVSVRTDGYANVAVNNTGDIYAADGDAVEISDGRRRVMFGAADPQEVGQIGLGSSVSVVNSGGLYAGYGDGVSIYAGGASDITVFNSGDIYAGGGSGIVASNGDRIKRQIQAPGENVAANPEYRPSISIENTGTIEAAYLGVSTYGDRFFFGIGGLQQPEEAPFGYLGTDVTVTNGADGVISSGFAGVIAGAYVAGDVTVINDGGIYAGGELGKRGPLFLYNAGVLAGGYQINGSVSVTNNGTVEAENGIGVAAFAYRSGNYAAETQSISVVNTGSITGGYAGVAAGVLFGVPAAPEVNEDVEPPKNNFDVSVVNSGSISATSAEYSVGVVISQGSVTNTGDITGGSIGVSAYAGYGDVVTNDGGVITGSLAAVSTGGGDDIVNAIGNAVFNGVVDGGEGSLVPFGPQQAIGDDPNDLDILNLDAFSGPSFTPLNFEEVNIVNGSSLTLDGATTFGGGALLIDATSVVNSFGTTNGLQFASIDNRGRLNLQDGNAGDVLNTTGAFTSTGEIAVDVNPQGGTQDAISNTGGAANVGGAVNVNLTTAPAGDSEHVIVSADGGVTDDGASLNLTDTQVTTFALRNDPNDLVLVISSDFAPQGLLDDGSEFGAYLNANQNDPALLDVFTLAQGAQNIQELQALYGTLNGIDFSQSINGGLQGGMAFGSGLFSCAVGEGQFAAIDEGQCGWTRIGGSYFDRDVDGTNPGVEETVFSVSTGGQAIYDENIRLGGGIGIDLIDSEGSNGLDADATRIHAGVSVKYVEGQMMAGVSLSAGYAFNDSERSTPLGVAEADFDTFDFSAIARAAYLADVGDGLYVKPQVQAGVHYVDRDGFTETGAGAANLQVLSEDEVFVSFSPSIEIGADLETDGMKVRPFLRVGATILSEDDVQTTARLAGAASATTFTTTAETGNVFGDVAAGVTVFADDEFTIRAEYNGRFSDDVMEHGGFLKVQYNF